MMSAPLTFRHSVAFTTPPKMTTPTTMSDLPLPLQSRIAAALTALPPAPSLQPILLHSRRAYQILPADLLPLAQAAPPAAAAVADALASRACYINRTAATGSLLAAWATALAPFLQALSFYDHQLARLPTDPTPTYHPHLLPAHLLTDALHTLQALVPASSDPPRPAPVLRSLDLLDIPFHAAPHHENPHPLQNALTRALEANKHSLRELAIPIHSICANALQHVHFPYLQVAEFEPRIPEYFDAARLPGTWTGCDFCQMFDALLARDNTDNQNTNLVELRLKRVISPPIEDPDESEATRHLVRTIRTLRVETSVWLMGERHDKIVAFIALFKQICCLHWDGLVTPKRLHTILAACTYLTELHLSPKTRFSEIPITEYRDELDINTLPEIFTATQGKLRTLSLKASLSAEHMKVLGENSPELQSFSAEIGPDNVETLTPLLASHCRKIRTLHLSFQNPAGDGQQALRAAGWRTLAAALCSASDELREVKVDCGNDQDPSETDVDELVDAIVAVLQHLGERATIVYFQVPAAITEFKDMIDKLCRLLETAAAHCRFLEEFSIKLRTADVDFEWNSDEEMRTEFKSLLRARAHLKNAARRLHLIDLDEFDEEAEAEAEGAGDDDD